MTQLFKYLPEPRDFFKDGFIRLTQLPALNDPFEAAFCKNSLEELVSHFDDSYAFDLSYGSISFSEYVERKLPKIGIISFSENKENLLMWAHYANEHRGIIAGITHHHPMESIFFNLLNSALVSNSSFTGFSPFDGIPKPVNYRKGLRYKNDKFDYDYSNISAEGADRLLYEVCMQKSDEWIYEQEYRVVLLLKQADRIILKSLEQIQNSRFRKQLERESFVTRTIDKDRNVRWIVDLWKIDDEIHRSNVADNLVNLGENPDVIFLMKLNAGCINNCLIGLNSQIKKEDIIGGYASTIGRLDVWKARKNLEYYCLDFDQV